MDHTRGIYRYETAPGRWWACIDDDDAGVRVNIERGRYEDLGIAPQFLDLPIQPDGGRKKA
jgi:hypothetical protein